MRISVALASYNGAEFIREQLDSLAAQTFVPDELVITDDGSTDRTEEIVAEFAATAPFAVHFHRNPQRLGYSRNFERALSLCTGDILFLCDQDDVWFPDKLATVTTAFADSPGLMVAVNDQILTDGALKHDGRTKLGNLHRLGFGPEWLIEGCCTAVRRAWADLVMPIPIETESLLKQRLQSHDRWVNELAILCEVRRVIEHPLQYFRRTGANTTSWIVSEPRNVGRREMISASPARAPVEAWQGRIQVLASYEHWLEAHRDELLKAGITAVDLARSKLDRERRSLSARIALSGYPLLRRLPAIAFLWAGGGYSYFQGWKSAIRDATRLG